jgi:hypothetical protein
MNQRQATVLSSAERGVLEACREAVARQREMLPSLAKALGVSDDQVFYTWAFRRCAQRGQLEGTAWRYFFHGLECDLRNGADGRFLRFDFGPRGRVDTFTLWGILQFIMTSASPWREFPELRRVFAKSGPPFDEFSGDWEKIAPVWDSLEARDAFAKADPALVDLQERFTTVGDDGLRHVRFPQDTAPETVVDCSVAHRLTLSARGLQLAEMDLAHQARAGVRLS